MIIMIDNYDSFTYNLYQYAGMIEPDIEVIRNDKIDLAGLIAKKPSHIIVSPGPGYPSDAGISVEVVREMGAYCPVLGICLGHQAVGEAFGGKIVLAPGGPVHGKKSMVKLEADCLLYEGFGESIPVARYHSLVVDGDTLPAVLKVTARTAEGLIMGLQHRTLPVYGVQFHPESILTENGMQMIRNFLNIRI